MWQLSCCKCRVAQANLNCFQWGSADVRQPLGQGSSVITPEIRFKESGFSSDQEVGHQASAHFVISSGNGFILVFLVLIAAAMVPTHNHKCFGGESKKKGNAIRAGCCYLLLGRSMEYIELSLT